VPYKVVRASNGDAAVEVEVNGRPKQFSPPEVSAIVLSKLKADAEMRLGEKVTQAVITVPAYFNDSQRQATKDAGRIAGLEVLRIIMSQQPLRSPTAWTRKRTKRSQYSTWGAARRHLGSGNRRGRLRGQSHQCDTHLGGDDWDARIMDWILDEFKKSNGMDLRKQPDALQRIKEEAEESENRAFQYYRIRDQPPLYYGGRERAQAHTAEAYARQDGAAL